MCERMCNRCTRSSCTRLPFCTSVIFVYFHHSDKFLSTLNHQTSDYMQSRRDIRDLRVSEITFDGVAGAKVRRQLLDVMAFFYAFGTVQLKCRGQFQLAGAPDENFQRQLLASLEPMQTCQDGKAASNWSNQETQLLCGSSPRVFNELFQLGEKFIFRLSRCNSFVAFRLRIN